MDISGKLGFLFEFIYNIPNFSFLIDSSSENDYGVITLVSPTNGKNISLILKKIDKEHFSFIEAYYNKKHHPAMVACNNTGKTEYYPHQDITRFKDTGFIFHDSYNNYLEDTIKLFIKHHNFTGFEKICIHSYNDAYRIAIERINASINKDDSEQIKVISLNDIEIIHQK